MSVYRPAGSTIYKYDFWFKGERHRESTGQRIKADAERIEWREKERLAQAAQGIAPVDPTDKPASPLMQDWANVTLAHKMSDSTEQRRLKRPDLLETNLRVALRFFGSLPADPKHHPRPGEDAPFHNLTLADPIDDPEWVQRFEDWMSVRRKVLPRRRTDAPEAPPRYGALISGSQKNSLRSAISDLYRVGMLARYRAKSGVTSNPWEHIARSRTRRRKMKLTLDQLRAWFQEAAPHLKIALAIGALAPALRGHNILDLQWERDLDAEWTTITVSHHKRDERGEPIVVPVKPQLRAILDIAWHHRRAAPDAPHVSYVVHYRGERIKSLKTALRAAARRANVPYGLADGTTFHTLRHFASTVLAKKKVSESERKAASGHADIRTVQIYTHLAGTDADDALAILSASTPLQDLVTTEPRGYRHSWGHVGKTVGSRNQKNQKTRTKTGVILPMPTADKSR